MHIVGQEITTIQSMPTGFFQFTKSLDSAHKNIHRYIGQLQPLASQQHCVPSVVIGWLALTIAFVVGQCASRRVK